MDPARLDELEKLLRGLPRIQDLGVVRNYGLGEDKQGTGRTGSASSDEDERGDEDPGPGLGERRGGEGGQFDPSGSRGGSGGSAGASARAQDPELDAAIERAGDVLRRVSEATSKVGEAGWVAWALAAAAEGSDGPAPLPRGWPSEEQAVVAIEEPSASETEADEAKERAGRVASALVVAAAAWAAGGSGDPCREPWRAGSAAAGAANLLDTLRAAPEASLRAEPAEPARRERSSLLDLEPPGTSGEGRNLFSIHGDAQSRVLIEEVTPRASRVLVVEESAPRTSTALLVERFEDTREAAPFPPPRRAGKGEVTARMPVGGTGSGGPGPAPPRSPARPPAAASTLTISALCALAIPAALSFVRPVLLARVEHEADEERSLNLYEGPDGCERFVSASALSWLLRAAAGKDGRDASPPEGAAGLGNPPPAASADAFLALLAGPRRAISMLARDLDERVPAAVLSAVSDGLRLRASAPEPRSRHPPTVPELSALAELWREILESRRSTSDEAWATRAEAATRLADALDAAVERRQLGAPAPRPSPPARPPFALPHGQSFSHATLSDLVTDGARIRTDLWAQAVARAARAAGPASATALTTAGAALARAGVAPAPHAAPALAALRALLLASRPRAAAHARPAARSLAAAHAAAASAGDEAARRQAELAFAALWEGLEAGGRVRAAEAVAEVPGGEGLLRTVDRREPGVTTGPSDAAAGSPPGVPGPP